MDNLQAKQMLKQVDCHGIPKGFNSGYSELYKYCLESIEKLERIEKIVKQVESLHPEIAIGDREGVRLIREVLNG